MAKQLSAEDKKWQAESDARALSEAEIIKGDRSRLSGAKKAAKIMAKDAKEQAKAMTKIAKSQRGKSKR